MNNDTIFNSTVIYGGSFDPVTNGHIEIIKNLKQRFNKVIVVPSFISPFKKKGAFADAKSRLKMLTAALKGLEGVEVSTIELDNSNINYTIDTVLSLRVAGEATHNIFFCIGSDMLQGLKRWHRIEELAKIVTLFVIPRPYFPIKQATLKRLNKQFGLNFEVAEFSGTNASSSKARLAVAFDKFDELPKAVADIIKADNLYSDFNYIVKEYPKFMLDEKRVNHIYGTAVASIELAQKYRASVYDATLAALLHDIGKWVTVDNILDYNIIISQTIIDNYPNIPEKVFHAFVSSEAVKQYFSIKKKTVEKAIMAHTTGMPKMSKLAKILLIADIIEPSRKIEFEPFSFTQRKKEYYITSLDDIRALEKIDAQVLAILIRKAYKIESRGEPLYFLTVDALEFYKNLGKKPPEIKTDSEAVHLKKPNDDAYLAHKIAGFLDEKKAKNIKIISLEGKTIIADYFVIASATSTTAVKALTDYVDFKLSKEHSIEPRSRDITPSWAAVDYCSVIMHIQLEEAREFYNLERLWA